jgi:hypothetical protein
MRRVAIALSLTFVVGIAIGVIGNQFLNAQPQPIKRTEVLKTDMAGMERKEAHMWVAEVAPGGAGDGMTQPGRIGRMTPVGGVTLFDVPLPRSAPQDVVLGADENVWFAGLRG